MSANPESKSFSCRNCGATTDFEVTLNVLKCAFCGSEQIIEQPADPNRPIPEAVIGFAVDEEGARRSYRDWLGSGWFRPGDLTSSASLREIRSVFLPFWSVDARARSQWTAMSGRHRYRTETYQATENGQTVTRERRVQETDWFPVDGSHEGEYSRVLVSASKGLDQKWVDDIEPFNFAELRQYQSAYLLGRGAEACALDSAAAHEAARQIIEGKERSECARLVPGDTHRDLRVSTVLDNVRSMLIFLPIWLAVFHYKGQLYRFVVNGQTGKVAGEAPLSYWKIGLLIGAIVLVILVIVLVASLSK
jgi:hypothetical protein